MCFAEDAFRGMLRPGLLARAGLAEATTGLGSNLLGLLTGSGVLCLVAEEKAVNLANKIQQEHKLKSEKLVVMAGGPPSIKEEMETSMAEELVPGSYMQGQEHLVIAEMMEHGSQSLGASQRRQRLDTKTAGSAAGQPVWNMTATRPKKAGPQMPIPRMLREAGHGDAHPREYPSGFQNMRFHYERNPEADMVAEIGLEELNGLEMEVMRRQLHVITSRLRALEDQGATWRHRDALFFTMLVSACVANLWLWMRQ